MVRLPMPRRDAREPFQRLEAGLLRGPAVASPAARAAAAAGEGDGPLGDYLRLVHTAASRVTPAQVEALRAQLGDDALFELTVCAAHGAARARLDAGLAALDEAFGSDA